MPKPGPEILNKVELVVIEINHSFAQVVLHDALYSLYLKNASLGKLATTSHNVVDYVFNVNPIPKGRHNFSLQLLNQTIASKYFVLFHTELNRFNIKGDNFYFENVGLTQLSMRMSGSTLNRYNQIRSSAFAKKEIIKTNFKDFSALAFKDQCRVNKANKDLILDPNILCSGSSNVGEYQNKTFLCNLKSIYEGSCIYSFSTSVQMAINNYLKESTRKGNVTFTFDFATPTPEIYYLTIFSVHNGEFFVSYYFTLFPIFNVIIKKYHSISFF